jgi:hypothetical protein
VDCGKLMGEVCAEIIFLIFEHRGLGFVEGGVDFAL